MASYAGIGRRALAWRQDAESHANAVARAEASVEACEARDAPRRMDSGLTPLDACAAKQRSVEAAEEALDRFEDLART